MFIALVRFPDVPLDRDEDFQDWFAWSNQQLANADGLRNRRLLRATDGQYSALVEHESAATFAAMHAAPAVAMIQERLGQIVSEPPHATRFEVVTELGTLGCCADGDAVGPGTHTTQGQEALAGAHGCCHAG